jgi:hypothetical protein
VCSCSLDRQEHFVCRYGVFKVHSSRRPQTKNRHKDGLSKPSSVSIVEVDIILGDLVVRTNHCCNAIHQRARSHRSNCSGIPRKEVIQPQLPLRLPCYVFTPIINPTFDGSLPQGVRPPASGVADFRGVTGGVYKAREHIHRGSADPRLLATPASRGRVAAHDPN